MRAILGAVSLLLVLGVVSLLAKKQLPQSAAQGPQQQSQKIQQEVKQQVEAALQQPRTTQDKKYGFENRQVDATMAAGFFASAVNGSKALLPIHKS